MTKPWLVGIGGTNASGKDTLANHLAEKYNYLFISTGDMVREVAAKEEGNILRPTLARVANRLRAQRGPGVLVELAIEHYKKSTIKHAGLIAASIRTAGEVEIIRRSGGILLFVDADPQIRYQRITSRQRADDLISYDQFLREQAAEWHQSDNPAEFSLKNVRDAADYSFVNAGDVDEFFSSVEAALFAATDKP